MNKEEHLRKINELNLKTIKRLLQNLYMLRGFIILSSKQPPSDAMDIEIEDMLKPLDSYLKDIGEQVAAQENVHSLVDKLASMEAQVLNLKDESNE